MPRYSSPIDFLDQIELPGPESSEPARAGNGRRAASPRSTSPLDYLDKIDLPAPVDRPAAAPVEQPDRRTSVGVEQDALMGNEGPVAAPQDGRRSAALTREEPAPYRNRTEVLDDAVNLIEEGADPRKVMSQAAQLGIGEGELLDHARRRNSAITGPGKTYDSGTPTYTRTPTRARQAALSSPVAQEPDLRTNVGVEQDALMGNYGPDAPDQDSITPVRTRWDTAVSDFGSRAKARLQQTSVGALRSVGAIDDETAGVAYSQAERRAQAARPEDDIVAGMQQIGRSKTMGEALSAMADNKLATLTMLLDSVAVSSPQIALSLASLPARGLATATGLTSGVLEFGSAMGDVLGDRGVDLTDATAIAKAMSDPAVISEIRQKGVTRGLTIGIVDGLTAGLASKFIRPTLDAIRAGELTGPAAKKSVLWAAGKELGLQMAGGGGGEAIAQGLTGEYKPADILLEMAAEGLTAPAEIRSNLREGKALAAQADPAQQMASALQAEVDSRAVDPQAVDRTARQLLSPDPRLIDPSLTTRSDRQVPEVPGVTVPIGTTVENQGNTPSAESGPPASPSVAGLEQRSTAVASPGEESDEQLLGSLQNTGLVDEDGRRLETVEQSDTPAAEQPEATAPSETVAPAATATAVQNGEETVPADTAEDWAPTAPLPDAETYKGIGATPADTQRRAVDRARVQMSEDFGTGLEDPVSVKVADPTEIGQGLHNNLKTIAVALRRAFGIDTVIADFGPDNLLRTQSGRTVGDDRPEAAPHGFYAGDGKTVVLNARSNRIGETLAHEPWHVLEARHPDLFQPFFGMSMQFADPAAVKGLLQAYGVYRGDLKTAVDAFVANPTPAGRQQLHDFLMSPNASRDARIARSEIAAHVAGEQATPSMYRELVRRTGSPANADSVLKRITEFLNQIYEQLFGRRIGYVKGPDGIRQIRRAMNEILTEWQNRTAQERLDRKAAVAARAKPQQAAVEAPVAPQTAPDQAAETRATAPTPPVTQPPATQPATTQSTATQPAPAVAQVAQPSGTTQGEVAAESPPPPSEQTAVEPEEERPAKGKARKKLTKEKAHELLDNLALDPETKKPAVRKLAKRLFDDGLINANDLNNFTIMATDRDMGPEDLVDDLRTSVGEDINEEPELRYSIDIDDPVERAKFVARLMDGKAPQQLSDEELAALEKMPAVRRAYEGVEEMRRRAVPVKEVFDNRMARVANAVGATLRDGPIKGQARAFAKAYTDYKGDYSRLKDIVRSTLVVNRIEQVQPAVDLVLKEFPNAGVKRNGWAQEKSPDETGYRDAMFDGIVIDGMLVELQLNTPEMIAAKEKAHKLYEESEAIRRKMDDPATPDSEIDALQQERDQLFAKQRAIYIPAYELALGKNRSRQTSSDIATPSDTNVENPNGLGRSGIEGRSGPSQATGEPPGTQDTGTPLQSQKSVPEGNLSGGRSTSISPGAIPEGSSVTPNEGARYSRVAAPVSDPDGKIRVNGREYDARLDDEPYTKGGTKKYMKRAIDTRSAPDSLPFEPKKFFQYSPTTEVVPVASIVSGKSDAENQQGGSNAPKRFLAAYDGILKPREPIAVQRTEDGKYKVIDGNGTLTAFKNYGWTEIPVEVFANEADFRAQEGAAALLPQYRAFVLRDGDRQRLAQLFPPTHERVMLDHISTADGQNFDAAQGEVIGTVDRDGIQALAVRVNGEEMRPDGVPYHITVSVTPQARSRDAGSAVAKGYDPINPIPIDLSNGSDYSAPASPASRSAARYSKAIDQFVRDYRSNRGSVRYIEIARTVPATALMTAQLMDVKGWGQSRPLILSGMGLTHIANRHPEIDDSIYAQLPVALENPRAVLKHKKTAQNVEEDSVDVILRARAKDGNPILIGLRPSIGRNGQKEVKITDVRTAMGWDNSATRLIEALYEGRVGYLPKEEVDRVRELLAGAYSPTATGLPGNLPNPKPINRTAASANITSAAFRGRTVIVPSDRSLVDYRRTGNLGSALAVADNIGIPENWRQITEGARFSRNIPTQGNRFTLPARTARERIANQLTNEVSRVEAVQKDIARQGGLLTDASNIGMAQTRMYRKAAAEIERFRRETVEPLLKRVGRAGIKLDDIALYLYAVHARERNSRIASINPQHPDGGSGMFNQEARDYLRQFRSRPDFQTFKRLAREFQSITRMTQGVLLREGLVDPTTVSSWNKTYSAYVPLKGWEDIDESMRNTHKSDPRVPFAKRALGRGSRAGQILENILGDYESAVVMAEKNRVRKSFLRFVRDNPDSALWEVNRVVLTKRFNKGAPVSPLQMAQGNVTYSATVDNRQGHTIAVRVGGQLFSVWVKDAAMMSDLEQTISAYDGDVRAAMMAWKSVNRTLGKLWTALSPAFVLINATRDLQTALISTGIEKKGGALRAAKLLPKLLPLAYNIWRAERNNQWTGPMNGYRQAYIEYRENGGKTGFMGFQNLEERQRELHQLIENAQNKISLNPRSWYIVGKKAVAAMEKAVMDINGGIENAARVAAYVAARQAGESIQSSVDTAANVTVDFARRGKLTPLFSSLYLFFNPAVQGARRTLKLALSPKGAAVVTTLATLGYFVAEMASQAVGDDDEPYWDKPDMSSVKTKNLVYMLPDGSRFTIPLAYGWGFFVTLGYAINDLKRGKPVGKVASQLLNSFTTHFSPFGSIENPATFILPTLADPVVVAMTGVNEIGKPLMPENKFNDRPDSERYYTSSRGTYLQQFTEWLNEQWGGSAVMPGQFAKGMPFDASISPETLKYLIGYATGGAGTFVRDLTTAVLSEINIGSGTALDKNQWPILKSFYRRADMRGDQSAFYENSDAAAQALAEMKAYADREPGPAIVERLRANESLTLLGKAQESYRAALSDLRKDEIEIIDRKDWTPKEKEEARKQIDEQRKQLYVDFNKQFYATERQAAEAAR